MKKIKRIYDVIFSLIILILLSPIFVIIGLIIFLSDQGPIIFCSKRVGCNGKIFTIYKFKTLSTKLWSKDKSYVCKKDDYRIFSFGRILRSTHMDELPQFVNVIKGDMSIVGPRPMPIGFRDKNLHILPGITGLSQVRIISNGKIKMIDQVYRRHDDFYQKNFSLVLDVYIVIRTMKVILEARGI